MLEARSVTVTLGRKPILNGIDLTARPGQLTAIVGPNGSGKTTLLRAMTGEVGYGGAIAIDGADLARIPAWKLAARRAVLPQAVRLSFPFTVLEVVRLGLMAGIDAGRDDLPARALSRVGLAGFEGRFYHELSGGEQQRAQLARVLVQVWEPEVDGEARWLFLDEPVSSLDIGHQLEVMQIAGDFAAGGGGVVAVMHDLNLTAMFADSVALIQDGRLAAQGAPAEVLTDTLLSRAYGCTLHVGAAPRDGTMPFILPQAAAVGGPSRG